MSMNVVHTKDDESVTFLSVRATDSQNAITTALQEATDAAGEWASASIIHSEDGGTSGERVYVVRLTYEMSQPFDTIRFE